jgi:phage terminase large subunit-like protein
VIQLNPEDKLLLAKAIDEKKRRMQENGIKYYKPQPQQEPFHRSTKRIRAVFGANRSGKTVGGATEAVWYATGTHPYKSIPTPNYGRIVCTDFTNGIEKVIIPEIKKWLPKKMVRWYNKESRTMELTNGSTIEFMSYDQDVDKFESASRHWIWFDEEPSQEIYNACKMRLVDTKGDLWITMTPTHGMTWVYTDIYERNGVDPNIECYNLSIYDNNYIDKDVIADIRRGLSEQEIEARLYGKFVQLSGLIYREYNPEIHNLRRFTLPSHWQRICAIDPHPRISTAVGYMAIIPKGEFIHKCQEASIPLPNMDIAMDDIYVVYDEIFHNDEQKLISDICKEMYAREGGDNINYRLIDNSSNTPDPIIGTTIREEFASHGIRTVLSDKDVSNRIFRIRERLQRNSIFFMEDLHETLWEIRHYAWDDYKVGRDYKDPKEKPRKKRDHMMDCIGYMAVSNPKSNPPRVYRPIRRTVDSQTGY